MRHHRTAGRRAGRRRLCRLRGPGRPVIDDRPDPQPRRLRGRCGIARDLAAAGLGDAEGRTPHAGRRRASTARWRRSWISRPKRNARAAVRARLVRGVKNGPQPGLAAGAAEERSACGRSTRWWTSPISDVRSRPAAARVRRRQGQGGSPSARRASRREPCRRSTARPMRSMKAWW